MIAEQAGFRFEIVEVLDTQLSNGEAAFVIFLSTANLDSKARSVTLSKATYVTNEGEQFEQDSGFSGYLIQHGRILGNAHRKSGLVFYQKHLSKISQGDSLYIDVEVLDRSRKLSLRFENGTPQGSVTWVLCGADVEDLDVKPTPRVVQKSLTKRIERLEAFEDRFGIALDKLSVKVSDDYARLAVVGEVHLASSAPLTSSIRIVAVVYDSEGNIIATGEVFVLSQNFSGFDVFTINLNIVDIGISATRIRVFPKAL